MTSQQLHDALSHLPDDLLEETNRRRITSGRVIPFRRYLSIAACFVLLVSSGLILTRLIQPKGATEMSVYKAAEAPAALAEDGPIHPESAAEEVPADECAPMEEAPAADSAMGSTENANTTMRHTVMILRTDSGPIPLSDSDTLLLRDLFSQLSYDPQSVCNCLAEYIVEMENEKTWEVNLTEGFVRTAEGQAILTEAQNRILTEILAAIH